MSTGPQVRDGGLPPFTLTTFMALGHKELVTSTAQDIIPGASSYFNVPFALVPGYRVLRMDVHVPKVGRGPHPTVLYASGGAWRMVLKHHGPWPFLPGEGYVVASVEYRASSEAHFPAPLYDVKAAIRFLRANAEQFSIDPDQIVGWGSSAGAFLISLAAVTNGAHEFEGDVGEDGAHSSDLRAVIDHYGATDLARMGGDTNHLLGVPELFGTSTSPETLLLGYNPADHPERAAHTNPSTYVNSSTVPFLIMHGDADSRVGIDQSSRFADDLRKAGVDVTFEVLRGGGHGTEEFFTEDANDVVRRFLARVVARPTQRAGLG